MSICFDSDSFLACTMAHGKGVAILSGMSEHIRKNLPWQHLFLPFSSQISGSQNLVRMLNVSSQAQICLKFVGTPTSRGHVEFRTRKFR